MANLQEIFNRIAENKKKQKDIRSAYKEAMAGSAEYQAKKEEKDKIAAKLKQIEESYKQEFNSELTKLDDLKIDMASDMELLNDAALTQLMKGETIEITDEYDNKYEPTFSVKFKKAN